MIGYEDEEGEAHDSTHYYQEEKDGFSHKQKLNDKRNTWSAKIGSARTFWPFMLNTIDQKLMRFKNYIKERAPISDR